MPQPDVPSPIDLRRADHALQWSEEALAKRPCRPAFFAEFARALAAEGCRRVLELGSGPGFLAAHLLEDLQDLDLTLLDFSGAMHDLARARLGRQASAAQFLERDFRSSAWPEGLGSFDAVVTHQAVHELRQVRHAAGLHQQVRTLLRPGGLYLVCDHHAGDGGMSNRGLFMTPSGQQQALQDAGFAHVRCLRQQAGLCLQLARSPRS